MIPLISGGADMDASQLFEIALIVSLSTAVICYQSSCLINTDKSVYNIPSEVVSITRIWSALLLTLLLASFIFREQVTPLVTCVVLCLVTSGYFIKYPGAQILYHISSTCSWVGCFDLYFRSASGDDLHHFLHWKWLTAVFITTSIVLRAHLGNTWQYSAVSLSSVGIPIVYLYYWGVEMPVCLIRENEIPGSAISCDLMLHPPSRITWSGANDYYRILGMILIVVIHVIFSYVMASFVATESESLPSPESSEVRQRNSSLEGGRGNRSPSPAPSHPSSTHNDCPTTAHSNDNISTSCCSKDSLQSALDSSKVTSLPDDLVEISEQEAFDIVQKGLMTFKTKRAV